MRRIGILLDLPSLPATLEFHFPVAGATRGGVHCGHVQPATFLMEAPDGPPAAAPVSTSIRIAAVDDAHWLAELAERTFRDTFTASNTPDDMAQYVAQHFGAARQAAELEDGRITTLIAEVDGRPAGYVQLVRGTAPAGVTGPEPLEIHRFYVDQPWHGRGVAQALMQAAADAACAQGARTLWLGVWERNPRAIAFYRKCGFQDAGAQTFVLGTDHQRDLVLARSLD